MSKRHSFKTSGESWAFWTFISHQWIAGPQTTTEFPGCLVSCHSLHSCSQKHTLCWKSVLVITSPTPLAWPGPTVWLERGCGTFCSVFISLVPCSVQLYHWYEVPLGRPASLVEIPREKFSETLPPFALGEHLMSTGDFSAPSDVDLMFYWVWVDAL